MQYGEVQQRLSESNRWWSDRDGWANSDPDLRGAASAPFQYTAQVLRGLAPGGLYTLRGPRRVGKSVEAKKAIESLIVDGVNPRLVVYMSVDGWQADDLGRLVDAATSLQAPGHRYWFIDEITSVSDGWPHRVKWLRDNDHRFGNDTVVLTGSSAADLATAIGTLLGRRGDAVSPDRVLLPMGFRTFASLRANSRDEKQPPGEIGPLHVADLCTDRLREVVYEIAPWLHALVMAWEAYLLTGGFPQAVASHIDARATDSPLPRSLLDLVHRDALHRTDWSRVQTSAFLRRLAGGLGSPVNNSAIANDLRTSANTVQRRITALQEAFVLWPCLRSHNLEPQLRAQEKLYFTDPIFTRLLPDSPTDSSLLSEQQLGMALLRALEREEPGAYLEFDRVLHHRNKSGTEIDFVSPALGSCAIESKYVDGRWKRATRTLTDSPWRGIVATRSVLDLEDPNLLAVPAALLAWLIDN